MGQSLSLRTAGQEGAALLEAHETAEGLWVDSQKEICFLTINCENGGVNSLAKPDIAKAIFETIAFRQEQDLWFAHLFVTMPDHVHGLVSFPPSARPLQGVVSDWKRWTARHLSIAWQSDFFEHRLRDDESALGKADYLLANPVRAKLVERPEQWPYAWFGGSLLRTERPSR
jgi:putative transposase